MHSMLVAPGDRGGERGRGHLELKKKKSSDIACRTALRMSWFSVLVADRSTGLGLHS